MAFGRKRKRLRKTNESFEINVTPMIDMFSVLTTFLLITAVFSATGQARVDVPFLSSRPPPEEKDEDKNPPVSLNLEINDQKLELQVTGGKIGPKPETFEYVFSEAGLDELQGKLYDYRKDDLRVDTITFMTDEELNYEQLVKVIDAVRVLKEGREPLQLPPDYKTPRGVPEEALMPKIVMGNVIL